MKSQITGPVTKQPRYDSAKHVAIALSIIILLYIKRFYGTVSGEVVERIAPPSHVRRFDLVRSLPDLAQAHGRVKPVEYGQWHGHVRDDGPRPEAVEVKLYGVRIGPRLLQCIDGPHGQVADQQERDDLPAGLLAYLVGRNTRPPGSVQYEHRLAEGLHQRCGRCDQHQYRVVLLGKVTADYRERTIYERARLRTHQ